VGSSTRTIVIGDLVRWTSPLYYVEDGKEHVLNHWCYALVIKVRFNQGLELKLIGKSTSVFPIIVEVGKLLSTGQVQVSEGKGKWRTLHSVDYL
jgi:hypothetical protein